MSKKTRDSNFEMLRLLSMFMIIILHLGTHGLDNYIHIPTYFSDSNQIFYHLLRSLSIIAVSIYVMISGYFLSKSTKFKVEKLVKLLLETSFFSIVIYSLNMYLGYVEFNPESLKKSLMSIFFGEYWFVTVYFVLYSLSPFLNKLIANLNKKDFKLLLLIMFLISCVWQFVIYPYNLIGVNNGYGIFYFVFLYLLAAYVRIYKYLFFQVKYKSIFLILYLLLAFLNSCLVYSNFTVGNMNNWYVYNSPIILLMSYCLFKYFEQVNIKSSIINFSSRYAFGIYLIHEQSTFRAVLWGKFGIIENIINSKQLNILPKILIYGSLIFISCWLLSLLISTFFNLFYNNLYRLMKKDVKS